MNSIISSSEAFNALMAGKQILMTWTASLPPSLPSPAMNSASSAK